VALKARIDEENALIATIVAATGARDLDALNPLISKCVELGIDSREEVKVARQVIKEVSSYEYIVWLRFFVFYTKLLKLVSLHHFKILEEQARKAALEAEAEKQRQVIFFLSILCPS
jgi:hypothetical protein